jgi:predicted deacylase
MTALGVRVGGDTVARGQAGVVVVPLPGRRGDARDHDSVPALVISGQAPGPRVAIVGAPRGFEVSAARLVSALQAWMVPAEVTGTVVLVPVLRPGGRFAAGGRPVKPTLVWQLPGDPAGSRAARDAFALSSALVGDSALILTVTEADPGRVTATVLKGDLDDPRARRLMRASGAAALVPAKRKPPAAPRPEGLATDAIHLELAVPGFSAGAAAAARGNVRAGEDDPVGDGGPGSAAFADAAAVVGRLLRLTGVWAPEATAAPPPRSAVCRHLTAILAGTGGFVRVLAPPGTLVAKGEPLARLSPPLGRSTVTVAAPRAGLVLEAPERAGTRRGAKLFVLGRPARTHGERAPAVPVPHPPPIRVAAAPAAVAPDAMCLGWVGRVSLPDLGLDLVAKIDTGARTSALHVTRIRTITTRGLQAARRPTLELTIPRRSKRLRTDLVVRVRVHDFIQIKDTSGRTERRPVIETTLRLGDVQRKIRVTLTDRGDMTYPMLIGRTALGAGVVIDPARRHLLGSRNDPARKLT